MPIHNRDISRIFNLIADYLEVKGENIYRVRAYRNAARTVEDFSKSIEEMIKKDESFKDLPGIGKDLEEKIKTIVEEKNSPMLENLKQEIPVDVEQLLKVEGLGPKKVKKLYEELDIKDIKDLQNAVKDKKIRTLEGFGKKTEENIKEAVSRLKQGKERMKYAEAEEIATSLVNYLKKNSKISRIKVCGSYRRGKETVGDLDILATIENKKQTMSAFVNYEDVEKVLSKGETKSSVILKSHFQVDLRIVDSNCFGSALIYFTGSKAHNVAIRKMAIKNDYKISEYGVFKNDKKVAGKTEKQVYKKIGLSLIPPELRENNGEIEAAKNNSLPELIEEKDIKGDLHFHTKETDGKYSLKEMAEQAEEMGYEYIGNTEHSKKISIANGLDEKRLEEQIKKIDKLNKKLKDIIILKSIEVDILADGSLDLSNDILKELDYTVCSVHSKFNMNKQEMTERILKAMDNPHFNILGHPTGRLINERPPYDIDMEKIMKKAKYKGHILELTSNPDRLDLNDKYCKMAKDMGVKISIATDSHSKKSFYNIKYGIKQARRGWLEKSDVINTLSLKQLKDYFNKIKEK